MAQIENCKTDEYLKTSVANVNIKINMLLRERTRAIDIAKAMFPMYEATN